MIKVILKHGDLIEERATFIVNASNTELSLGSGVSKAFRQNCGGNEFQQTLYTVKDEYLQEHTAIKQGDVLLSDSGECKNFNYALHAAIMNYTDKQKSPLPSYQTIKKSLIHILRIIQTVQEKEGLTTMKLVVPLMGTGVGGLDKEKVFSMIKEFFESHTATFDLEVIIMIHSEQDFLRFKQYMRSQPESLNA